MQLSLVILIYRLHFIFNIVIQKEILLTQMICD